jgi:hypothetical protein
VPGEVLNFDLFFISSKSANPAFISLHFVIATLIASGNIILPSSQPFRWVDDALGEASLTFNQPNFTRCLRYILAFISAH